MARNLNEMIYSTPTYYTTQTPTSTTGVNYYSTTSVSNYAIDWIPFSYVSLKPNPHSFDNDIKRGYFGNVNEHQDKDNQL
jgi:hypothetical protein